MRVLCAGDGFISPELFVEYLRPELDAEFSTHATRWPAEPWQTGDEVHEFSGDESEITSLVSDVDILVTHLAPVTDRVLRAAPGLRLVATPRGGPTNVNVDAATKHGVAVLNLPGRNARAVAEFTVGLLIAGERHIVTSAAALRGGEWTGHLYSYDETGRELAGRTVGLVGLGQVGARVADLLRGFGVRLLGCDPYVDRDVAAERGVRLVGFGELLESSDVVSLHARLTAETHHMVNASTLARMRPGAYLVNTARGGLVDEQALVAALESGRLGGAALDTYAVEPPGADNPLLALPNVVAVSHLAGASKDVAERGARRIAQDVGRFVRGEQPVNLLNPGVPVDRSAFCAKNAF